MFWNEYWYVIIILIILLPILAIIIFAIWMSKKSNIDDEVAVLYWEVFVKSLSAFTVIFGGAMLFGKYIDQQETLKNREFAFREATFLREKLIFETERYTRKKKILLETKSVAGRLVANQNDSEAGSKFEQLYSAELIGVEQQGGVVEQAMINFRKKWKNSNTVDDSLNTLSIRLSTAIEKELAFLQDALVLQHRKIADLVHPPS